MSLDVKPKSNVVSFGQTQAAKFGNVTAPQALRFSGMDTLHLGNTVKFGNNSEEPKPEKPAKVPYSFKGDGFPNPLRNFWASAIVAAISVPLAPVTMGASLALAPLLWLLSAFGVGRGGAAETPSEGSAAPAGAAPDGKAVDGKTAPAPAAVDAKVEAANAAATTEALAAVKAALGSDDTLKKVLIARLTGQKLDKAPLGEERATQALVQHFAELTDAQRDAVISTLKGVDNKAKLQLSNDFTHEYNALKALFGKPAGRGNYEILAKEGGSYSRIHSSTTLHDELDAIALAAVLERSNHLTAVVNANRGLSQQLRSHVDSTYKPYAFGTMTRGEFDILEDKDKASHRAEFNRLTAIADPDQNLIDIDISNAPKANQSKKFIQDIVAEKKGRTITTAQETAILRQYVKKSLEIDYGLVGDYADEVNFVRGLIGQELAKAKQTSQTQQSLSPTSANGNP
ncbi:MAG: hypothetical protein QE263_08935 [Vampirovibrionales bacterium]|nr:hypothetical protein [Vampirovibrionales bacterium]